MQQKPLPSQQLPQCKVCNLDPVPESTQHLALLILQITLIFINFKFSIIVLMIGYSFPRTLWKCPFCSRQVQNVSTSADIKNNIILRMGNCMALFSLNKFRVLAAVVIAACVYFYTQEPRYKPLYNVKRTWESLIQNAGYEAFIENSFRANTIYQQMYSETGNDWELKGIFLDRNKTGISTFQYIFVKMNPSQFKQPSAYDFKVFTKLANKLVLNYGDQIYLKGQWQGRQYHNMVFIPYELQKTGKYRDPTKTEYIYKKKSMLREHFQAVQSDYISPEQVEAKQQIQEGQQTQQQQQKQQQKQKQQQQQKQQKTQTNK